MCERAVVVDLRSTALPDRPGHLDALPQAPPAVDGLLAATAKAHRSSGTAAAMRLGREVGPGGVELAAGCHDEAR
jgi:hypothetical protein